MAKQLDDSLSYASTEDDESNTSVNTSSETISSEEKEITPEILQKLAKKKLAPVALRVIAVFVNHPDLFKICRDKQTGVSFEGVINVMSTDKLEPGMSNRNIRRLLDLWRSFAERGKLLFTLAMDVSGLIRQDRVDFYEILRETGGIMNDPPTNYFRGEPIEKESGAASVWPKVRGPSDIWTGSDSGARVQLVDEISGTTTTISSRELGNQLNEEFIRLPKEERLRIACESIPQPEETRAVRQTLRDLHLANMDARQEAANALTRDLKIQDSGWRKLQRGAGIHRSPRAPVTINSVGGNSVRVFQEAFLDVPESVCERSVERTSKDTLVFQLRLRPYQVVDAAFNDGSDDNESKDAKQNLGRFLSMHEAHLSLSLHEIGVGVDLIPLFYERLAINRELYPAK